MGKWIIKRLPKQEDKDRLDIIVFFALLVAALLGILFLILWTNVISPGKKATRYSFNYDHTSLSIDTSLDGKTLRYESLTEDNVYRFTVEISSTSDNVTLGTVGETDSYLYKASSLFGDRNINISFYVRDLENSDLLEVSEIYYKIFLGEDNASKTELTEYETSSVNNVNSLDYVLSGNDIYLYSLTIKFTL